MSSQVNDFDISTEVLHLLRDELQAARKRADELDSGQRETKAQRDLRMELVQLREQLSSLEGAHKIEITRANAAEAKAMALAESVKKEEPDLPLESNKAEGQNLLQVNALIEETKLLRSQLEDYERAHVSLTQKLEKEAAEGLTARQKNTRDLSLIQSLGSKIEEQAAALQAEEGKLAYIKIQLFQAQKSLGDRDKENAVLLQSVEEKDNLKNLCVELRTNLKKAHSDNEKLSKSCNVQAEEIESLKAQLSSMKEKRDRKESRQEQASRQKDEKIQELESHAEKLAKENSEAVQEKRRLQSADNAKSILINQRFYTLRKFQDYTNALPIPQVRPEGRYINPIGHCNLNVYRRIKKDELLAQFSESCLQLDAIQWFNSCHALGFGPSIQHELNEGRLWSPSPELLDLHGQTKELFYVNGVSIFYAGTYKCHPTERWSTTGVVCPWNDEMLRHIMRTQRPKNHPIHHDGNQRLMQLYRDGTLRLDTIFLECIGFNHFLYNRLLALFDQPPNHKRPQGKDQEAESPANTKKAKINSR